MRAFLSHSSKDKHIVDQVAKRLGRAFVVYDSFTFEGGDELKAAVLKGLDQSELFVLFASRHALRSDWVNIEISEAETREIQGAIKRIHVVLLDNQVSASDLPKWLTSALATRLSSPALIANQIQRGINSLTLERQSTLFIGRNEEMENAARLLAPISVEQREPSVFLFHGLQGMGRRTLCRRVVDQLFAFRSSININLQDGDDVGAFHLKLWEELHPSPDIGTARARKAKCEASSPQESIHELVDLLASVTQANQITIVNDLSALVDNDGFLHADFEALFLSLLEQSEARLAIVSTRKPQFRASNLGTLPSIQVRELPPPHTQQLLARLARSEHAALTVSQCADLAKYIRGFPPAAYYAIQQVKSYSADAIVANKVPLVNFRVSIFMQYLLGDHNLDADSKRILLLLAHYSPLPLAVIGAYTGLSPEDLDRKVRYLSDASLAYPAKKYYQISEPIAEAVTRAFSDQKIIHKNVCLAIEKYLSEADEDDSRLDLGRALNRAALLSGEPESSAAIALVSDFIGLTKDFYHSQDYRNAISTAQRVLEQRPNNADLRSYLARAYIQEEMFDEATKQIEIIRDQGYLRDAYYLKGFLERHNNSYGAAISAYLKAREHGRKGVAIHRELAQCYLEIGELEDARKHIELAHDRDPDNRYVVDLEIKIAIRQKNERLARERLGDLRFVDTDAFFHHRQSTVDLAFGRFAEALASSTHAVENAPNPPFAMLSHHVNCLVHNKKFQEGAAELGLLDTKFPKSHHDERVGLRCKLLIWNGEYDDALGLWMRLREKDRAVHRALKLRALRGKASTSTATSNQLAELRRLEGEMASLDPASLEVHVGGGV